jgi:hypothetical protein
MPTTEAGADRYPHVMALVREQPWAILPAKLAVITDLLRFRAEGGRLTAEQIADRIGAAAERPNPARSPRTVPSPREVSIGEFSTRTKQGSTSQTTRAISRQSPLRLPSRPSPLPATLMSWHGKPPETTSAAPRHARPSKVRTSSQIGNG